MLEFDIKFKDTDPDSGEVTKEVVLATSKDLKAAMWIKNSLEYLWFSEDGENDPNREFFVQEREVEEDDEMPDSE
jgi:hypothetical protein